MMVSIEVSTWDYGGTRLDSGSITWYYGWMSLQSISQKVDSSMISCSSGGTVILLFLSKLGNNINTPFFLDLEKETSKDSRFYKEIPHSMTPQILMSLDNGTLWRNQLCQLQNACGCSNLKSIRNIGVCV